MFYGPARFVDVKDGSLNDHVRAAGVQTLRNCYKYIDAQLEGEKWAVGDDFTAVDAYLFVFYWWGVNRAGLPMETDYPNYARVMAAVSERESVKAVLSIEGVN
jgi:glutathione S-transferase